MEDVVSAGRTSGLDEKGGDMTGGGRSSRAQHTERRAEA